MNSLNYTNLKVGDYVYKYGTPQTPGKILSLTTKNSPKGSMHISKWVCAEVKWINGKVEGWNVNNLRNFDTLIAEHEKKLKTHRDKLPKLEAL